MSDFHVIKHWVLPWKRTAQRVTRKAGLHHVTHVGLFNDFGYVIILRGFHRRHEGNVYTGYARIVIICAKRRDLVQRRSRRGSTRHSS